MINLICDVCGLVVKESDDIYGFKVGQGCPGCFEGMLIRK